MRLYLSSYGVGNKPEELVRLVGERNKRVAVIVNAGDADESYRPTGLAKQITILNELGFQPEEIDLRKYFGKPEELKEVLTQFGLIWVRGGNVFILKRAFEQSGLNKILPELLQKDAFVYGGYSAGAIVVTPTLIGVDIVDDAAQIPPGYSADFSWEGLNLVPYSIAPHFESNHPESEKISQVVQYFKVNNIPFKSLRDGEVLVINREKEEVIG